MHIRQRGKVSDNENKIEVIKENSWSRYVRLASNNGQMAERETMQHKNIETSYQERMLLRCYQWIISPLADNNDKGREEAVRWRGKGVAAD